MATKTTKPDAVPEVPESAGITSSSEPLPIERLREECGVSRPVFAGVCAANGWRPGRVMTEAEFHAAVEAFTGAPMGAHSHRKAAL